MNEILILLEPYEGFKSSAILRNAPKICYHRGVFGVNTFNIEGFQRDRSQAQRTALSLFAGAHLMP